MSPCGIVPGLHSKEWLLPTADLLSSSLRPQGVGLCPDRSPLPRKFSCDLDKIVVQSPALKCPDDTESHSLDLQPVAVGQERSLPNPWFLELFCSAVWRRSAGQ